MEFYLKQLQAEDVKEEWAVWYHSSHTEYYTRSGREISLEELRESIRNGATQNATFTFGVFTKDEDYCFGTVKIGAIDQLHGLADLSVLIGDTTFLGKGLGTAIVEQASNLAFSRFSIRKLHSGILEKNISSLKSYTRAGWIVEGVLFKHYKNHGVAQDWYLISKFNPTFFPDGYPTTHAIKLP